MIKSVVGSLGTRYTARDAMFMQAFKPEAICSLTQMGRRQEEVRFTRCPEG